MQRQEQIIHKTIFAHLRARGAPGSFAWHTPMGGYRRPIEAAILKSLGAVAGFPDICVLHRAQLYALEVKTETGKVSDAQRDTMERLQKAGAIVAVAHGLDAALQWMESNGLLMGRTA